MSDPSPLPTPIPLPDELRERARAIVDDVEWQMDNFLPAKGETSWQCQRRRLIEAIAEALSTLTATKPSGQVERVARAIDPNAWEFIDAHEHDEPPHPAVPLTRERTLKQARAALAALSTQVQTVGGEIEGVGVAATPPLAGLRPQPPSGSSQSSIANAGGQDGWWGMTNGEEPQHPFGKHETDCGARDGCGCNCAHADERILPPRRA